MIIDHNRIEYGKRSCCELYKQVNSYYYVLKISILGQLYGVDNRFAGDYYQGDMQQLLNFLMQHDRSIVISVY